MTPRVILIRNAASYDFGGGERFPVFVAQILRNNNIEPIIISRNNTLLSFAKECNIDTLRGWWWHRQNWSGINALLFPVYLIWQLILFCYYTVIFLQLRPQAVHIQSKDDFIAGTYAAKLIGAKVVWTDHADLKHIWKNIGIPFKNPVGKLVYLAARTANTITLVSESEKSEISTHLPAHSLVRHKLQVVHNGTQDKLTEYPADKQPIFTFGVVGRLLVDKGINEVIEAFNKIHSLHPDTQLLLVGSGPHESKFKHKAKNNPAIFFTGHQTDPFAYMAKLDVFMQPTYHEGFSVSLVEATMMQLPIIATRVGGNGEIIKHQKTGLLVNAKDSNALADAMELLYSNTALANQLAMAARHQYEQKFIFDNIVKERFMPLYEISRD